MKIIAIANQKGKKTSERGRIMGTLGKMALTVIMLVSLLISQSSNAETYKWVDEKGTVHFTEDPATIPEKYWDKAKSRMTEEDLMTPEEKIRAKKKQEEEVREQLKRENKEYNAKEFEKRVKEIEDKDRKKIQEQRERGCEIISYSQYDIISDVSGDIIDGEGRISSRKSTCVDLVIKNNTPEAKTITERNLVAKSSKSGKTFNPKAVFIRIGPGETYRGSICFKIQISIAKLELQGL
jgi:hypothetical protein